MGKIIRRDTEDHIVKDEEKNSFELNIHPPASILNVFSRLSYKPWYAIAEFVDNSTQSYISHQKELDNDEFFDKLVVDVRYDSKANTLSIIDNAYGMEKDRFEDAIILDSRNETQSGRNEFGMGLKTAASWFGEVWTVKSTQYGSNNRYVATVDIPKLKEDNLNSIEIRRYHVDSKTHKTEIIIVENSKNDKNNKIEENNNVSNEISKSENQLMDNLNKNIFKFMNQNDIQKDDKK